MQTHPDYTTLFRDAIKDHNAYYQSLHIARMNTRGKIWVVGGFVYRTIAAALYGGKEKPRDIDFLAEHLAEKIIVPAGWTESRNTFGNPKLSRGATEIDLSSLGTIRLPTHLSGKPTVDIYLVSSTLTIQCIAYDVQERRVMGETGTKALLDRTVAINNPNFNKDYFIKKGYTLKSYLLEKAAGLGFRVVLPPDLL